MSVYRTVQGDTWDMIAYKQLGSTYYTDRLVSANLKYREIFLFTAGIELVLPEIPETLSSSLPPWKR